MSLPKIQNRQQGHKVVPRTSLNIFFNGFIIYIWCLRGASPNSIDHTPDHNMAYIFLRPPTEGHQSFDYSLPVIGCQSYSMYEHSINHQSDWPVCQSTTYTFSQDWQSIKKSQTDQLWLTVNRGLKFTG